MRAAGLGCVKTLRLAWFARWDWVGEDNPVRVIDAFVDGLDPG
jgi:hypothetical protein